MAATPIYYTVIKAVIGFDAASQSIYRIATTHPRDRATGITEIVYIPNQPRRYVYGGRATPQSVTARHRQAVQRAIRRWNVRDKAHLCEFSGTRWTIWGAAA